MTDPVAAHPELLVSLGLLDPGAEVRLRAYLDQIGGMLGDKRRRRAFAKYACGILSEGERKSVEPIATRACGSAKEADAEHRRVLRFLAESEWEDRPVRGYASRYALAAMQQRGPVRCSILDDTGFLKQGRCSPCVQRQYTGSAGKTTNCQIGVSLSVATDHAHLPVDMQLYMPESWANDPARRRRAKIPESLTYRPKWKMGLDMIENAVADGIPLGVVLADADYGNKAEFRDRLDELNLEYAVAVQKTTCVRRVCGAGNARRFGERQSVEDLAFELRPSDIRSVTWREGTKTHLRARFGVVRVEPMPTDGKPRTEQWLIIEWPEDSHLPEKYALATVPPGWSRKRIVRMLKERWRTERAYEDLKRELGLDHFEGRSYGGWNHHVTVVMLCYAFLVAEQARAFPPSQAGAEEAPPDGSLRRAA